MANGFNPNTWPTFQQSMPVVQGMSAGEALRRAYLQNQQQQQQNQFQPDINAAKLAQMQATTQGQQQQNQFRPDLNAAKLAQMQASTQGQQISNQQSPEMLALKEYMAQVAAKNAEHVRQNINLQYDKLPTLYANAAYRQSNIPGVQSAMGMKGDPTGIMSNFLSGAAGFSDKFAQVSGQPSSSGYNQPSPKQQMALQQALQQAQQNRPQEQSMREPNFPALQQYLQQQAQQPSQGGQPEIPQQGQQPIPQAPDQQQQMAPQQAPRISPEVLMRAQDATRSAQIKKNTTAQIANQMKFAGNVKVLGDNIETQIPLLARYFGIEGRAKLLNDKRLAKDHKEPPEYGIYKKLSKSFKLYANDMGRMMGNSSSNEQKEAMEKLVDPEFVFSNPDLALSIFKGLRSDEARTAKSLSQSLSQTQDILSREVPETDQTPQAQSSTKSPPVGSAAPAGTVEMVDDQGLYHAVDHSDLEAATKHGWRKA